MTKGVDDRADAAAATTRAMTTGTGAPASAAPKAPAITLAIEAQQVKLTAAMRELHGLLFHAEGLARSNEELIKKTVDQEPVRHDGFERMTWLAGAAASAMKQARTAGERLADELAASRGGPRPLDEDYELYDFVGRLVGWTKGDEIEQALRSLELARYRRAQLVLWGHGDLVPIAHALHRRVLGAAKPFIVCSSHRGDMPASARSPKNHRQVFAAFAAAQDGTLCVRSHELPEDFEDLKSLLRRSPARVQLIVCASRIDAAESFLVMPAPICIPPLKDRSLELSRIVAGYALDAVRDLGVTGVSFDDYDRLWILRHASGSHPEIEKAALRLMALRVSRSVSEAARRLGMEPVSLLRWVLRRKPLPPSAMAFAKASSTTSDIDSAKGRRG